MIHIASHFECRLAWESRGSGRQVSFSLQRQKRERFFRFAPPYHWIRSGLFARQCQIMFDILINFTQRRRGASWCLNNVRRTIKNLKTFPFPRCRSNKIMHGNRHWRPMALLVIQFEKICIFAYNTFLEPRLDSNNGNFIKVSVFESGVEKCAKAIWPKVTDKIVNLQYYF